MNNESSVKILIVFEIKVVVTLLIRQVVSPYNVTEFNKAICFEVVMVHLNIYVNLMH